MAIYSKSHPHAFWKITRCRLVAWWGKYIQLQNLISKIKSHETSLIRNARFVCQINVIFCKEHVVLRAKFQMTRQQFMWRWTNETLRDLGQTGWISCGLLLKSESNHDANFVITGDSAGCRPLGFRRKPIAIIMPKLSSLHGGTSGCHNENLWLL